MGFEIRAGDLGEHVEMRDVRANRFLTFFLDDEEYGLEIVHVREILEVLKVTPVPLSEGHVLGVLNLRGKLVTVIDLRLKFGMPHLEPTERSCIIVVEHSGELVGVFVDAVSEVIDISEDVFEETSFLDQKVDEQYISGVGKIDGKIKILLAIENVLAYDKA